MSLKNKKILNELEYCHEEKKKNLAYRMIFPQRHRLLYGYPMSSGLIPISRSPKEIIKNVECDPKKKLAIGIIPHPFCNPRVYGCGYCTFPHEKFCRRAEIKATELVVQEINNWKSYLGPFLKRPVQSLYLGGGTANLMAKESWQKIITAIKNNLQLIKTSDIPNYNYTTRELEKYLEEPIDPLSNPDDLLELPTEITFEGVSSYFTESRLVDYAEAFPNYRKRISIGIQTFNQSMLTMMGREAFNNNLNHLIKRCHELNISVSGDFMFNLPGQSWDDLKSDLKEAIRLGIDQICWYNLVCYRGLKTTWANNPEILKMMPSIEEGLNKWLKLSQYLKKQGYIKTSVTNFRHKDNPRGIFVYENALRRSWHYDLIGAGITAISMLSNWKNNTIQAVKMQNPLNFEQYKNKTKNALPWTTSFTYDFKDLQIFYLTRVLKGSHIKKKFYQSLFHSNYLEDFKWEIDACVKARLLEFDSANEEDLSLTDRGAYYLDSITGLFAENKVKQHYKSSESNQQNKIDWLSSIKN